MVVLSVGMEISEGVRELGRRLGVELDEYGFCRTLPFQPLQTSRPGIFAVGPFREPKDIPESVVDASGAAAAAGAVICGAAAWSGLFDGLLDISGPPGMRRFMIVYYAHTGAYAGGASGGLAAIATVLISRRRMGASGAGFGGRGPTEVGV